MACLENRQVPFFDAGDFPELFERTDAVPCLDTGYAYATDHDAAAQAGLVRRHGDRISQIHPNETRRRDDDERLPVGVGRIGFAALAAAVRETGWPGTCTREG